MNASAAKPISDDLRAPPPWFVSGTRTRHNAMPVLQIISEPTGEVLALVPYSDRTPKAHAECYADARLIAAAPDLLAALAAHLREHDQTYDGAPMTGEEARAWELTRAALAKVAG